MQSIDNKKFFIAFVMVLFCISLSSVFSIAKDQDRIHYRFGEWHLFYNMYDYYFQTYGEKARLVFHNNFKGFVPKIEDDMFLIPNQNSKINIKDKQVVQFSIDFGNETIYADSIYLKSKNCFVVNCSFFKEKVLTLNPNYINFYNRKFNLLYGFSLDGYIAGYSTIAIISNDIIKKPKDNAKPTNRGYINSSNTNELNKKSSENGDERNFWLIFTFGSLTILSILIVKLISSKSDDGKNLKQKYIIYCPRCHCWLDYYLNDGDFLKCKKCGLEFNAKNEWFKINNPEQAKQQADEENSKRQTEEAWRRAEQKHHRREQEEAMRREQEEARRRAEQERQRREQEEARRKAEQERVRREQEEARRRAEQEKARREQESSRARRTSMTAKEAFDIFELPHTATFADVKKKRVFLLKFFHPDHHYEDKEAEQFATEKARKINEAYEILKMYFETKDR